MACTPQQIEEKRKVALEKLNAKKIKLSNNKNVENLNTITNCQHQPVNNSNKSNNYQNKLSIYKSSHQNHSPISKPSSEWLKKKDNSSSIKQIRGTCYLISSTKFEIDVPYNANIISIFKSIPSRQYNPENKNWFFPVKDYELVLSKLRCLQPDVYIEPMPNFVLNFIKSNSTPSEKPDIKLERIEKKLLDTLMPFQREGVDFGISHLGRCLIADDMGLGKTLQALAIASYYRNDWPLLIVTTASMKTSWEETIYKYLPSVPLASVRYMSSGKDFINDAEILIISHELLGRYHKKLLERRFKFLIIDESHVIKNFKTKCTQAAKVLAKEMNRVVLLSGTPAMSRPSELYTQLELIHNNFFGNFKIYSKRYCNAKETTFGWDASGKSNLVELEIILLKKFMIRRTKNEVLGSLPGKQREVIKLDVDLNSLSEEERTSLNTLVENYIENKSEKKHSALLSLFAHSAKIKIPSVCKYIENTINEGKKFLVFAHHQVMLDAISSVLNKKNIKFIRIDGNTSTEQRKFFIYKFQMENDYRAAVLSITAANSGITLTAAQLVLFAELHWNPSILSQAESRAHRIGQSKTVIVKYLIGGCTVDDHIWPLLQFKQDVLNEIGLSKESFKNTNVKEQFVPKEEKQIENGSSSSSSLRRTSVGTNDIASYMTKPPSQCNENALEDFFNDDMDELFMNADF